MSAQGSEILTATLHRLGVQHLFGLPGTQNLALIESLRRSPLKLIVPTHEMGATFMAGAYYRASGRVGVVTTIPGPGFTYALTGLAEAKHDSAAVLYITLHQNPADVDRFRLQVIDQSAMTAPVVKRVIEVTDIMTLAKQTVEAHTLALDGEPGPVMLAIDPTVLNTNGPMPDDSLFNKRLVIPVAPDKTVSEIAELLKPSSRVLIMAGQGAAAAEGQIRTLASRLHAPVMTTCSGRGIVAEDDPINCTYDFCFGGGEEINHLIDTCDYVLALGCKFTHNGSGGWKLKLPHEKLIHIDASIDVLGVNYPADREVLSDTTAFVDKLLTCLGDTVNIPGFDRDELVKWKARIVNEQKESIAWVPRLADAQPHTCADLFKSLQGYLPQDALIVTDSGLHQMLTRSLFQIRSPRGLIAPSDFQSMGFGLPAAIGAAIAQPGRKVVLVIGDGGLAMSAGELATAVREKINLSVLLLNDHSFGLIRLQQIKDYGHEHAVSLGARDYEALARSAGANYVRIKENLSTSVHEALDSKGVTLIEVRLQDTAKLQTMRAKNLAKERIRAVAGKRLTSWLKRLFGRK